MVAPWKLLGVLIESVGEWEAWDLGNIQEMSLLLSWHIDLVTWIRLKKKMGLSFSAWHFQYFVHPDSFMFNPTFFSCNTLVQAVHACTEPKDWNRKCPSLAGLKESCVRHKLCQFQFSSAESQLKPAGRGREKRTRDGFSVWFDFLRWCWSLSTFCFWELREIHFLRYLFLLRCSVSLHCPFDTLGPRAPPLGFYSMSLNLNVN